MSKRSDESPSGITMRDVETLLEVAQHLRDVQDWRAQGAVRLIADVARKLLPIALSTGDKQ